MQIVERIGQRKYKVSTSECVLCITARDCVASERGCIAEILKTFQTVRACTVSAPKPRDAHTHAWKNVRSGPFDDFAHDLMARNDPQLLRWQFAFHDVKISATHASRTYAQQHVS